MVLLVCGIFCACTRNISSVENKEVLTENVDSVEKNIIDVSEEEQSDVYGNEDKSNNNSVPLTKQENDEAEVSKKEEMQSNVEKGNKDSDNPEKKQDYNEEEASSEEGENSIEKCYDNPNNPVAEQKFDVGEPVYE